MNNNPEMNVDLLTQTRRPGKLILEGIEDHHDAITAHAILMHTAMAEVLPALMYQGAKGLPIKGSVIKAAMVKVVRHLLALCDACEYDLPEEDEITEFEEDQPYIIKNDSVLTITDMMMASLDIPHVIHVDLEGMAVWSEESPPEEMVKDIKSIIVGIRHLGRKHNFTLREVLSEL